MGALLIFNELQRTRDGEEKSDLAKNWPKMERVKRHNAGTLAVIDATGSGVWPAFFTSFPRLTAPHLGSPGISESTAPGAAVAWRGLVRERPKANGDGISEVRYNARAP